MDHNLSDTISLLSHTPSTLDALLRNLPETWTRSNEGGDTWTTLEVLGHLIDADRTNWIPRAKSILQFGETQPFPPFDRGGHLRGSQGIRFGAEGALRSRHHRYAGGACGDSAEAEYRRHQGNDEEDNSVVKHDRTSCGGAALLPVANSLRE